MVADGHDSAVENYVNHIGDQRIRYDYVEHCGYPAKARNLAISKAKGEYLAFCDDDDTWAPEKLALQLSKIRQEKALFCFTDRIVIDGQGNIVKDKQIKWVPKSQPSFFTLLLTNYITYSSVLVHHTALDKTEGFLDDIRFKSLEDYHLWLLMIESGMTFTYLNSKLTYYRIHLNNISEKLSKGQSLTFEVVKDVFKKVKVPFYQQYCAYTVISLKFLLYKIVGK